MRFRVPTHCAFGRGVVDTGLFQQVAGVGITVLRRLIRRATQTCVFFSASVRSRVAVFFVFWGGWSIVTAFGNSEGIEKGKKTFGNAVIGFFLIMVAYILLNFTVVAFTGQPFDSLLLYIPYP